MRDELFVRGDVPMTKSEIRTVCVSKLELETDSILYDIGAGTGSVSVEASRYLTNGKVFAVEKKPEAQELIKANKKKFSADCITVIKGSAPEALSGLETATHVFLGGTSGNLEEILELVLRKNPDVRVVANFIALESLSDMLLWLKKRSIDAEIVQMQVSRAKAAGSYHMMLGQNPVYIISFGGKGGISYESGE
ncbi:precorrin-6Y C5,15-methyltransferase (decarboxylating) subunit CbiT [Clostridium boliviensis]|uniref:Precorrin-6Y C5,15-methyltransferase (Decarboxylating) subunit CbiT n=1 Tax=Clostridium boliviensis TaxID=318465 RepID=A0ABU4GN56_9CLOT|nr:precorrin-6Y C5,15-methyltransferase (decarboxylating) subunit CbiT [Clostridium boliviensis]MDW2799055.1 precorrin-6Y C5,15-methyltransferase (decarboxylating) subunit CbiT [Clostridium boliviensis]